MLDVLKDKRLVLVSGKGGVGKTTVSVALAMWYARQNKRVLIVEMGSTERVAPLFGLKKIGHHETELAPHIFGINLNPRTCFEEYVALQVPIKKLVHFFLGNAFVTRFLDAVPGLNELLLIGKIYDLERQGEKGTPTGFDVIVVDAPATGHGISTFEVPIVVTNAVRGGPMQTQASRVLELLRDKTKTAICPVALPEEMPVVETVEFIEAVNKRLKMPLGPVFLNDFVSSPVTEDEEKKMREWKGDAEDRLYPYFAIARHSAHRGGMHRMYRKKLELEVGKENLIVLPHVEKIEKAEDLNGFIN